MFFNTIKSAIKSAKNQTQEGRSVFDNNPILTFESLKQQVRELAYKKWEESGYQNGKDEEFWVEAERELFGENPMSQGGYRISNDSGEYTVIRPEI